MALESSRLAWSIESPRGPLLNAAYNAVVACRLHRLIARSLNRSSKVATRLLSYLADVEQGPNSGIFQVIYGHTHWATQFEFEGIQFLNGGAALHGLPFRILKLEIEVGQDFEL